MRPFPSSPLTPSPKPFPSFPSILNHYYQRKETMKFPFLVLVLSVEFLLLFATRTSIFHISAILSFMLIVLVKSFPTSPTVYLADFACYKPPKTWRTPVSTFLENSALMGFFSPENIDFMAKVLTSSGLGEQTPLPPPLFTLPPDIHRHDCIEEAQTVLFPTIDDLLNRTSISPQGIDFLIVNCSAFTPTPSLSSIIINHYSMRTDIRSYNLSGMGCGAGMLAIDMATNLLRVHRNRTALILSTEILTNGWYTGDKQSKLVLNCLFRMGCAAILLTNKEEFEKSAKYKICCTMRSQMGFDDGVYYAVYQEEDKEGKVGVTITKDSLKVVGRTVQWSITIIGSRILPVSEKVRYGASVLWKRFVDGSAELYVPNFKTVVQHFCLPPSGTPVIRGLAKGLRLNEGDIEPAVMTLHRFGNQSSSALWYELAYMEAKERIKKGDKVWQLGKGSGGKCNTVILQCIRPITGESVRGPWADSLHQYPVQTNQS